MLQIKNIKKEYRTGSLVQQALDDVSLNLRDNEFVAVLGPSGSGKTTLLNIIGGLDRYDSGDLIINGVSTKQYKDRDWDSYRNHTIGFVFQSYNLIPHQTLLSNVELALTISGVSRAERKQRAEEALTKVGLRDHMHKLPNQLSGGQMQRVAIARALVNDPDILLADEPTGALDSDTSLQVMELLKEVAEDRLVVMVTHNPELAERYATRIVRLRDGRITDDSDPFVPEGAEEPGVHRNLGKASMGFLTALSLSFKNLLTKKTRTLLVAFAGSIGIIGIALILSLSNGVNKYIKDTEEDTLSEYPVEILENSFSLSSLLGTTAGAEQADSQGAEVTEIKMVGDLLSALDSNDLGSLKSYLDSDQTEIDQYAKAVEYSYDIDPMIYRIDGDTLRQVNPNNSFDSLGLYSSGSLFSSQMMLSVFSAMPEESSLYMDQYDVKAGHWPENSDECIVALTENGVVSDFVIYTLGLRDADELDQMIEDISENQTVVSDGENASWHYEDLLGTEFRVVNPCNCYTFDTDSNVFIDRSSDTDYMKLMAEDGRTLKVVGVVQPREDASAAMLDMGLWYPYSLIEELGDEASDSAVVKAQMASPDINVLTGKAFGDEESGFDLGSLFSIDESALTDAFSFDASGMGTDLSSAFDLSGIDLSSVMPSNEELIASMIGNLDLQVDDAKMQQAVGEIVQGYLGYLAANAAGSFADVPGSIQEMLDSDQSREIMSRHMSEIFRANSAAAINSAQLTQVVSAVFEGYRSYADANGLSENPLQGLNMLNYLQTSEAQNIVQNQLMSILQGVADGVSVTSEQLSSMTRELVQNYTNMLLPDSQSLSSSFVDYMNTEEGKALVAKAISSAVSADSIEEQMSDSSNASEAATQAAMQAVMTQIGQNIASSIASSIGNLASGLNVDADSFAEAFSMNMDESELQSMLTAFMSTGSASYKSNLASFGYLDRSSPSQITIYPLDFEAKEEISNIIEEYNEKMQEEGQEEKMVTYTDLVGVMMSSVTKIVNIISYVLVAFVAISLIVSSIMIGVITYISVLERRKEIGILRAMGASRKNIGQVFNAETFITGLLAGVLGILISRLILIPGNAVIHKLADSTQVNAYLPVRAGVILILLSVVLTLIGGLIPSRKAANSDPVTALRTE